MTEQTSTETSEQNAVIVETFLNSLQDQDFAAVDALIADDIVYQNVGLPTIRGGNRVKKLLRGMEGRMGFEVKFHRNVADGATVLNERTDAIVLDRCACSFGCAACSRSTTGRSRYGATTSTSTTSPRRSCADRRDGRSALRPSL